MTESYDHPLEKLIADSCRNFFDKFTSTDRRIKNLYGNLAGGIDHVGTLENYMVTIQDKAGSYDIDSIVRFAKATNDLVEKRGVKLLAGIFACVKKPGREGFEKFEVENDSQDYDKFVFVVGKDEEDLVKLVTEKIRVLLQNHNLIKVAPSNDFKLRSHQERTVASFCRNLEQGKRCGIISHVTGSGKTVTVLCCVGEYLRKNPGKSILWLTERKEVLESQFVDGDELSKVKGLGYLEKVKMEFWFQKGGKFDEKVFGKPIFLISNMAKLKVDDNYLKIPFEEFGMIIHDECHSCGADYTYEMMQYIKNYQVFLLGVSATPIRPDLDKMARTRELFSENGNVNFIDVVNLLEAIDEKIIVPPRFVWVETQLRGEMDHKSWIKNDQVKNLICHVEKVLAESVTNKVICWTQTIQNATTWQTILSECKGMVDYPYLSQYDILISNSENDKHGVQLKQFSNSTPFSLIICTGRGKEGYNNEMLDTGIHLDSVQTRGEVIMIQEIGRLLRNCQGKKVGTIMDVFRVESRENVVNDLVNRILNYPVFLEMCGGHNTTIIEKLNVVNGMVQFFTMGGIPITFEIHSHTLQELKWDELKTSLKEKIGERLHKNPTLPQLREIIRPYHCKTIEQYREIAKDHVILPEDLEYKFDKVNWVDFLGIRGDFYNDLELECEIVKYKHHYKNRNYIGFAKSCHECDGKFPPGEMWDGFYQKSVACLVNSKISPPRKCL